ncbi:hypothetical protein EB235_05585 [Mesorhizobium loti R88b]|uniref:Uncharacterized protein n=1 Tax=Mesorhizobium loti R88b TaxID=935548 RepID=A0A6M7WEY1_RHILI|nr:hypothetical protein EB235_05585 [Mesorhizobium loti R88b]
MAVLASFAVAKANDYAPASLAFAELIECRADVPTYNGFALWLGGQPDAPARLSWKEIPAGNFFLKQYELPAPLHVFGRETASVVFTATGPMAVFDDFSEADPAWTLGVIPAISAPDKFLGKKVVAESTEDVGDVSLAMRIKLNVSNVDTHPGKTLAGCSFVLDAK